METHTLIIDVVEAGVLEPVTIQTFVMVAPEGTVTFLVDDDYAILADDDAALIIDG